MQAWQNVKVINAQSAYASQAGYVLRFEENRATNKAIVYVKLDLQPEVQQFDPSELQVL